MEVLENVGVGELIGKRCVTGDDVEIGEIVYTGRDRTGEPEWIDVVFDEEVRKARGWDYDRVRLSTSQVRAWDDRVLELSADLDRLTRHWQPVDPEPIERPSFDVEESQAG